VKVTACECERPGYCARHRCTKPEFLWELCQRRPDWFDRWEAGENPFAPVARSRSPCRHRSADPIDEMACESCSRHTVLVPVYACERFQRCAELSFGLTTAEKYQAMSCPRCQEYAACE
jgi:hypothetical protein